jgi:lipopolysaccharide transport system ATP-binding protein
MMTAIALRAVSKAYRIYARPADRLKEVLLQGRTYHQDFWALREISLEVPTGTTFGIIGQNGSGKSTLLQIMAGIVRPSGAVQVNGRGPRSCGGCSGHREETSSSTEHSVRSRQEMERRFEAIARFARSGRYRTAGEDLLHRDGVAVCLRCRRHVDPDIL